MSAESALNRLAKWRGVFAGWQLGTRPKGDPESDAIRDHREVTILMRCELNAFAALLIEAGVITAEQWEAALEREADLLCMAYEARFPGIRAVDEGLVYDGRAIETMKGWLP
jgi:hypothetical protein